MRIIENGGKKIMVNWKKLNNDGAFEKRNKNAFLETIGLNWSGAIKWNKNK
jgi:hypothetical protein